MLLKSFYIATIFLKVKGFTKSIQAKFQIFIVITSIELFEFSIVTSQLKSAALKCISTYSSFTTINYIFIEAMFTLKNN